MGKISRQHWNELQTQYIIHHKRAIWATARAGVIPFIILSQTVAPSSIAERKSMDVSPKMKRRLLMASFRKVK